MALHPAGAPGRDAEGLEKAFSPSFCPQHQGNIAYEGWQPCLPAGAGLGPTL